MEIAESLRMRFYLGCCLVLIAALTHDRLDASTPRISHQPRVPYDSFIGCKSLLERVVKLASTVQIDTQKALDFPELAREDWPFTQDYVGSYGWKVRGAPKMMGRLDFIVHSPKKIKIEMINGDPQTPKLGSFLLARLRATFPEAAFYSEVMFTSLKQFQENLPRQGSKANYQHISALAAMGSPFSLIPVFEGRDSPVILQKFYLRQAPLSPNGPKIEWTNQDQLLSSPSSPFYEWLYGQRKISEDLKSD